MKFIQKGKIKKKNLNKLTLVSGISPKQLDLRVWNINWNYQNIIVIDQSDRPIAVSKGSIQTNIEKYKLFEFREQNKS